LNYFNYFTEIEDTFIRRRARHLLLSPIDWALIETWKQIGVPLHIVLRGIEHAFDSWESKPRKRTVKSLLYCQEEVEAQYAEWLESRVGAHAEAESETTDAEKEDDPNLPFSRTAISEHLRRGKLAIEESARNRKLQGDDNFTEALGRASKLLEELSEDFETSHTPNARRLEDSLTGIERMLSDAIQDIVTVEQLESVRAEVAEQLRPYRNQMDKAVYQQTMDNLLLKRLREEFAVPRLSLFYI